MRKIYEQDASAFLADAYTIRGHAGIAWYVLGWETEPGACEWFDEDSQTWEHDEEPELVRTGRIVAIMIGDDHRWTFNPEDIAPLEREDYCGECEQMGCTHDGLDRATA